MVGFPLSFVNFLGGVHEGMHREISPWPIGSPLLEQSFILEELFGKKNVLCNF